MAHMEPMDVDSISNDFDDKENSLQNSNVLSRTPSTEKGYEELDVSELNMKLRYSMTPATSPMSRSFTANCRDNRVCDNENNSINTIFNDNSNLTHSFNSTLTDSILKSSKFPLQALPTEQFVDDNGNPIVRSLDVECNNVTITVNGTDNIDDNLSLPSTSSSLAHTPEATTPTKEIVKDGGSPIMRGLKSVLNMFRSSQSPIPPDDITTNDLTSFVSQKKEESSNYTTNLGSSPTTTNKNKENISKTNIPLKESLVFNEDLEKELLWKDETTIVFKEEKIPVYKLFFPPNSAALERINSKNMNSTVENMDGSFNEASADKDMTEFVKLSSVESDTLNSPESDSEFVDCETSYTKNDSGILDDNITNLSPIIKNRFPDVSITHGNTFQPHEIGEDEHSLSVMADTDLAVQTNAIISHTQDVIKVADIDESFNQAIHNDLPILRECQNQMDILSNSLKEDIPNDLADKCNNIVNENGNELVQCSNETFNLEISEVLLIDTEYKNDIGNTSDILDDASLCEEGKEDYKEFYSSQITKEIEDICSGDRVCDFDSTIVLNELTLKKETDNLKINNFELPLDSQVVNEQKKYLGVLQDQVIITDKNIVMPLVKCEKALNDDNKINVKLDSEINIDTILKQNINENEAVILSDQIIQLETKEIKIINSNLPSDIPLPYDSDIEKDNLQDMYEENVRENDESVNSASNNLNFDLSYSTESIQQTNDGMTLTETHSETLSYPEINNLVTNTSVIQKSQLEPSEDMSNITKYMTVSESDVLDINNTEKCLPEVIGDTKYISSKIMNSVIFPSNSNYSESGIDLDVPTQDNKNEISQTPVESVQTSKSTDIENETSVIGMEFDVTKHDSEDNENPFETKDKLTASFEVQRSDSVIEQGFLQNHVESVQTSKSTDIENETSVIGMELDVSKHDSEVSENPFETKDKLTASFEVQRGDSVIEQGFLQNHVESVQTSKSTDIENVTSVFGMELDVSKHDSENSENPFETKNKLTASFEVQRGDSVIEQGFLQNHVESVQTSKSTDIENETSVIGMELDVSKHDSEVSENPFETKDKLTASFEVQRGDSVIEEGFLQNHVESVQTSKSTDIENETSVIGMELDVSKHDSEISENPFETKDKLTASFEVQRSDSVIEEGFLQNHVESVQTSKSTDIENETSVIGMELDVSKHDSEVSENPFETKDKLTASFEVQRGDSVIEQGFLQSNVESVQTSKSTDIENETSVIGTELDVSKHDSEISENPFETKDKLTASFEVQRSDSVIEEGFLQNHVESVQTSKSTDIENETSVIGIELDVSKHDSEVSENPFETKNKLTASLEVQRGGSVIEEGFLQNPVESVPPVADDKNYIKEYNEIDVRFKYDEVDITITNINTSVIGMDLDESENEEIPGRNSDVAGVVEAKSIDGIDTFLNDKNEKTIITDVRIIEEINLPSNFNTEMELDVSKPDLEDVTNVSRSYRNSIDTQNQVKSSTEEQGRESVIENISVDDCNVNRNENDLKINEVINIPKNSNNSVTEMDLDVSKHDLVNENQIKALGRDRVIEDCEIMNNGFKSTPRLTDEGMEITSKRDVTINDELIFPLTKEISSEIDLGVSKYDEAIIETKFDTKGFITPSPQISSKLTQDGYSIDFDELDDPSTTKTNSPTSNINKDDVLNTTESKIITEFKKRPQPNRRKTLEDRRKSNVANKGANTSFQFISSLENRVQDIYIQDDEKPDFFETNTNSAPFSSDNLHDDIEINTPGDCTFLEQTEKIVEDADIHLSNQISSSSSKIYESKNVFNLPEIGDMNFKPFTTTSNINDNQKASSGVCYNPLERTTIESAMAEAENNNVQDLESNLSPNLSNVTCSSKNANDITSVREVHTEDEDTVEGPFLEAEDFSDIVKVSDFETQKDMMNFEDLPTRTTDDNDNDNGEFFIDAEAFEFLLNQNKSNVVADSGKESLFLKFDPLFAKRISSDGVLAALNKIQKRQSTPKKLTPLKRMQEENPTPGPSTTTPIGVTAPVATDIVEEPVAAMSKPMMVVNPAIASFVSPKKSTPPPRVNRRSLTFTSPAMAVIDRLLSLSGNSSNLDQDSSLPINREYNETDYALTQLRELLADKEIHVHNLRSESKELKERFAILESQVRSLETESEERLRKVKELNDNLAEKNKINKNMAIVVEEYERTIASLIAEMEQERKQNAEERKKLISERDEQTAHLASMEVSFSDLHSKYEKSKQIILSMKANEDIYKKSLNEFEVNLLKMQTNYDLLKQHATSKLNHANQELEKFNRAHDGEVLKLNAMVKRKELQITSLEESLSQKTKANEELTAICDELINKVG